jgi:tetratricopeptide (TPR) repeat protein
MSRRSPERLESCYLRLQAACREAVHRGCLKRARDLSRRAGLVAHASGRTGLMHRAATTRSMVLLELGEVAEAEKGLREVVLQSADDRIICRAAFYLASSLRRQRCMSRALVFAHTAAEKAATLDDPVWRARCHNLLGNIHLNQNELAEALREYHCALEIWHRLPGDHRFARAIVLDNVGYCLTLNRQMDEGIATIRQALELALEIGDRRTEAECRQDLAHAFLIGGNSAPAREHAEVALGIAEETGYSDVMQNCCYILGELAAQDGDPEGRDAYFSRLQAFFPDFPYLREFLRMFDVRNILTFH